MPKAANKELSFAHPSELLQVLQARYEKNKKRHQGIAWTTIHKRLRSSPDKLWSLQEMERTGGEPDVVGQYPQTGAYVFVYHNGAQSYFGVRGFRGLLQV